ncbi:hypothetical protein VNO78_09795 [Psophocarpus tetragonolobus]|uniref:Uncharacterized protein n=1 Tax=Psophocarpus tetragonolobus TaxID=3891 RepID=A0AAN9SXW5_PSOTE
MMVDGPFRILHATWTSMIPLSKNKILFANNFGDTEMIQNDEKFVANDGPRDVEVQPSILSPRILYNCGREQLVKVSSQSISKDKVTVPFHENDLQAKVIDFVSFTGGWDIPKLYGALPLKVCHHVIVMELPSFGSINGSATWKLNTSGQFIVSTAYSFIIRGDDVADPFIKHYELEKSKNRVLLWKVVHQVLPTNQCRFVKHLANSDVCILCHEDSQ